MAQVLWLAYMTDMQGRLIHRYVGPGLGPPSFTGPLNMDFENLSSISAAFRNLTCATLIETQLCIDGFAGTKDHDAHPRDPFLIGAHQPDGPRAYKHVKTALLIW